MNVIIRLQNLPWSANALDIRQFFKGLSIPDGGVHIVGGEMGDAFIAFSTDEDARQAMMHDRDAINGVQVRLLLSSRAEMQKVIETARQQSLRALQNSGTAVTVASPKVTPPTIASPLLTGAKPQPPVITANSLHSILSNSLSSMTPSFLAYQQQAGISLMSKSLNTNKLNNVESNISPKHREHHLSNTRERRSRSRSRSCSRSRSKDNNSTRRRRERSQERSKDREGFGSVRRRSGKSRDRSYERDRSRSRDRSRERSRNSHHTRENRSRSRDRDVGKFKSNILALNASRNSNGAQNTNPATSVLDSKLSSKVTEDSNTTQKSLTSMNNYSLNNFMGRSSNNMGFALQNPYTAAASNTLSLSNSASNLTTTSSSAIPGIFVEKKTDEIAVASSQIVTESTLLQESIVFADTNPYEKMYPNLFAQAASIGTIGAKPTVINKNVQSSPVSPREEEPNSWEVERQKTRCVKIMNMCPGTTYSDIRKFCVGLYIPHNGIKMVNDAHGLRVGVAYIQFSKNGMVAKAVSRNNHLLRNKAVSIEAVTEEEFENVLDSFHPDNRDRDRSSFGGRGDYNSNMSSDGQHHSSNMYKNQAVTEPFNVLYIEEIPTLTTEQDIMKMFSSYSLYDILLMPSPENRREFVAHVRFSREEDAMLAYEESAHHQIGYRRLRVRPGSVEEMDRAKEKIRLANEQLMKEEQAAAEAQSQREQDKEAARIKAQKEVISLDLTQSDGEGGVDDMDDGDDDDDFIESTNKLIDKVVGNEDDGNYEDNYDYYKELDQTTDTDTRNFNGDDIPSHCVNVDPIGGPCPTAKVNDPRLRKAMRGPQPPAVNASNTMTSNNDAANLNNFNPTFNDQQCSPPIVNSIESNFVILKNCAYNTRINDVAQLLITGNLALKHIEPLHNERQLPTGEFIVEFRRTQDTEVAVKQFHNIQFMSRSLRVFPITPQEIADRLAKPFLGYIPGGNGIKVSNLKTLAAAMNVGQMNNAINNNNNNMDYNSGGNGQYPGPCGPSSSRFDDMNANSFNNNHPDDDFNENTNNDNSGGGGGGSLPERFLRPGCVLELENVPYKAHVNDILNFFNGFNLQPDDIIRRFNDNGMPTGDARVAFNSPEDARNALESRRRKQIFNRTVYLNIL